MVGDVEAWDAENALRAARREIAVTKTQLEDLRTQFLVLEEDKKTVDKTLEQLREKAMLVREKFVVDISQVLYESRRSYLLQSKVRDSEECAAKIAELESQLMSSQDTIKSLEMTIEKQLNSIASNQNLPNPSPSPCSQSHPHPPTNHSTFPSMGGESSVADIVTEATTATPVNTTATSSYIPTLPKNGIAASSLTIDMEKEEIDKKTVLRTNWKKLLKSAEVRTEELSKTQTKYKKQLLRDIKEFKIDV
jgi:hypothetical protein